MNATRNWLADLVLAILIGLALWWWLDRWTFEEVLP